MIHGKCGLATHKVIATNRTQRAHAGAREQCNLGELGLGGTNTLYPVMLLAPRRCFA